MADAETDQPTDAETDGSPERREELNRHWYYTADQITQAGERRDRYVVFGAAGAIVLSITFLNQVAAEPVSWSLWALVLGWVALLVAMGCSLASWDTTYRAHQQLLKGIADRILDKKRPSFPDLELDSRTRQLTVASLISLYAGVFLLAFFAVVNLPWSSEAADDRGTRPTAEQVSEGP